MKERHQLNKELDRKNNEAKEKWIQQKCDEINTLRIQHKESKMHVTVKKVAELWRPKKSTPVVHENNILNTSLQSSKKKYGRTYCQPL